MKKQPRKSPNKTQRFPAGWDEKRVRRVLEHYENQSEDEAVAEDEAAFESRDHTVMMVPNELVPEVRKLMAKKRGLDQVPELELFQQACGICISYCSLA